MTPYVAPAFKDSAFNCPHCNAFSKMDWYPLFYQLGRWVIIPIVLCICAHCRKSTYWLEDPHPDGTDAASGIMILPISSTAPMPHPEMPEDVLSDYQEARNITGQSPRGSAALLRLAIQKICINLGEKGRDLNADIGSLVKKGLPVEVQRALDIVRVTGNHAVHPGELSKDDVAEVSLKLFELVNYIVEDRISRPKKLLELFNSLPPKAQESIKKRDA